MDLLNRNSANALVPLASVLALGVALARAEAQCPHYEVDMIPGPTCFGFSLSTAMGISEAGELCGNYSDCSFDGHAAVWLGQGPWLTIPLPTNVQRLLVTDINSRRQMAGEMEISNAVPPDRAAVVDFDRGIVLNIGLLPGSNRSDARAINESGAVCGLSANSATGPSQAFLWQNGQMKALNLPIGPNSDANDVSESGAVCGWMGTVPHIDAHAYIWRDGKTNDLGVVLLGALGADALGFSPNGRAVCGRATFPDPDPKIAFRRRAFLWQDGVVHDLGVFPNYTESHALAVNDSNIVVGYCYDSGGSLPLTAFVWRNGVMTALTDLIAQELNLEMNDAVAINNAGQIAGRAELTDDDGSFLGHVAVRLTPVTPPAGDCDCNGHVGIHDLLNAITQYGPAIPTTSADFDNNGAVDIGDILTLIANWD